MISGTIAGISSFTVYPLGEITIQRPSYYISYTPSSASGTMWIKSNSTATPVSYQISSYSGMLKFGNSYPSYLSFKSCNWRRIETNIPMFNRDITFSKCDTLRYADLYNCTSLSYTFTSCYSLSQVSLPLCEYVGDQAFFDCSSLSQVNLSVCSYIGSSVFESCYSLSQVSLPMCEYIGERAFYKCSSLSQINLPMCKSIGNYVFYDCDSLSQVSLSVCSYIGKGVFWYCYSLSTIILGYSSVCSLYDHYVLSSTGITQSRGSIYVPASLVSAYKSANGWWHFSAIIQSYPGL